MNALTEERPVYIVDGSRTPFLKATGVPGPFSASDLAVHAARPLLLRQPFEPAQLDEVILGNVITSPDEVNIARVAALRLGCGGSVPAWTVQRNCGSGMQAIDSARQRIAYGHADLVLAGGTEAMSRAPILFNRAMATWLGRLSTSRHLGSRLKAMLAFRPAMLKPVIGLLKGLTDPTVNLSMGQTAEILAYRFGITRAAMDAYAARSHHRLAAAASEGRLTEIETLYDANGRFYESDEGCRPDSSAEKLAKLRPAFDREFGLVTAGNSAQVTDGAAWVILAGEEAVRRHQLPILARVRDGEWAGIDPAVMGLGPIHAMTPLLQRHYLGPEDIDYWEINEAFATQILACLQTWQDRDYCRDYLGLSEAMGAIDQERLNIDGGGISLGHPVGASGARIVLHLCRVLQDKAAARGIASLCIGGGQGGAMLIERDAS